MNGPRGSVETITLSECYSNLVRPVLVHLVLMEFQVIKELQR